MKTNKKQSQKKFLLKAMFIFATVIVFGTLYVQISFAVSDSIDVNAIVVSPGGGGGCGSSCPPPPPTCPPTCPPPPATTTPLVISNVIALPTATSALITWTTNLLAISNIDWGSTQDYESGSLAEATPGIFHEVTLSGLTPGSKYYFLIISTDITSPANKAKAVGSFKTSEIPDTTPPANALNFNAIYNPDTGAVDLFWDNPTDPDFTAVRIMRSSVFYPSDPGDGQLVYDGSAEQASDSSVVPGTRYYYTLFTRDGAFNWSSGVIATERVPLSKEPGCEERGDCEVTCEDRGDCEDPFRDFPDIEDVPPEIEALVFDFVQNGKLIAKFSGGEVVLSGNDQFSVSVDYEKLPEILKTIAVTITSPRDHRSAFTFLLRVNADKTKYEATIAPLRIPGEYPLQITVLDYKHQKVKRFNGTLTIYGVEPLIPLTIAPSVRRAVKTAAPIGVLVGTAAVITETVIIAFNIGSAYDIYLLFIKGIGALLGLFGVRKKKEPWGTVYDAVTKRPLDPAYIRVVHKKEGKEVADAITDLDGRYGFFLPEGEYTLEVNKTNYRFPSRLLAGRARDELYRNLYYGEPIVTGEGEIISRDVPLDPVKFDWNEFVKNKRGLFRLYTRRERIKNAVFNLLYGLGFLSSLLAVVISPIPFNYFVLVLYGILFFFRIFWKYRHRALSVVDTTTKDPLPFSIIRVFSPPSNQEVKAVVTDALGRFYILVAPGTYYVTVESKQPDGSYKKVYQSGLLELSKGVLNKDIFITPIYEREVRGWV